MIVSFEVKNAEDLDLLLRLTKRLGIPNVDINNSNSTTRNEVEEITQDIAAVFGTTQTQDHRLPFDF